MLLGSALAIGMQGCQVDKTWERAYLKRQWEQNYLDAQALFNRNKFDDARAKYMKAISVSRQMDPQGYRLAYSLAGAASCLQRKKQTDAATKLYLQAAQIERERIATLKESSELVNSNADLFKFLCLAGALFVEQKDYKLASTTYGEALKTIDKIKTAVIGYQEKKAVAAVGLAECCLAGNDYATAEQLCSSAMVSTSSNLPSALQDRAIQTYESALKAQGKSSKLLQLQTVETWTKLKATAHDYWKQRDVLKAYEASLQELEVAQRAGATQMMYAISLLDTGKYSSTCRPWNETEAYLDKALKICDQCGWQQTSLYDSILERMCALYLSANPAKALEFATRSTQSKEMLFGSDSKDYSKSLVALSQIRMKNSAHTEALAAAKEAYRIYSKGHDNSRSTAQLFFDLGLIFLAANENDLATKCLKESITIFRDILHLHDSRWEMSQCVLLAVPTLPGADKPKTDISQLKQQSADPKSLAQVVDGISLELRTYKRADLSETVAKMAVYLRS